MLACTPPGKDGRGNPACTVMMVALEAGFPNEVFASISQRCSTEWSFADPELRHSLNLAFLVREVGI